MSHRGEAAVKYHNYAELFILLGWLKSRTSPPYTSSESPHNAFQTLRRFGAGLAAAFEALCLQFVYCFNHPECMRRVVSKTLQFL